MVRILFSVDNDYSKHRFGAKCENCSLKYLILPRSPVHAGNDADSHVISRLHPSIDYYIPTADLIASVAILTIDYLGIALNPF